jgi:hypothetical protein
LVQWATNPTWSKLRPPLARTEMLSDDAWFLADQLRNEKLRLLLVNGMAVVRELNHTIVADLEEVAPIVGCARRDTRMFVGSVFGHVRVVAWSTNIQSSFGVTTELREELAKRVRRLAD